MRDSIRRELSRSTVKVLLIVAVVLAASCSSNKTRRTSTNAAAESPANENQGVPEYEIRTVLVNRMAESNTGKSGRVALEKIRFSNKNTYIDLNFRKSIEKVCFHPPKASDAFFIEYELNGRIKRLELESISSSYECPEMGRYSIGDSIEMRFAAVDNPISVTNLSVLEGDSAAISKSGFWRFTNLLDKSNADEKIVTAIEPTPIKRAYAEVEIRVLDLNRLAESNTGGIGRVSLGKVRFTNKYTYVDLDIMKAVENVCFHEPGGKDSFFIEYEQYGQTKKLPLNGVSSIYKCPNRGGYSAGDRVVLRFPVINNADSISDISVMEGPSAVANKRGYWRFANLLNSPVDSFPKSCKSPSNEVCLATTWGPDVCSIGFDKFAASKLEGNSYDVATSPICGKIISESLEREFGTNDAAMATFTGGLDDLGQAGVDSDNIFLKGLGWYARAVSFGMKIQIYDSCMASCR